jgi:hypothetical protein
MRGIAALPAPPLAPEASRRTRPDGGGAASLLALLAVAYIVLRQVRRL